jgi:hypothetical protein
LNHQEGGLMARDTRGEEFWAPHIKALRASGQTSVAYARAHDLSVQALGWWRRKLHPLLPKRPAKTKGAPTASKFVALKVSVPAVRSEPALPRPQVTVFLAGEVHLQLCDLPPPTWLADVVDAMRGRS